MLIFSGVLDDFVKGNVGVHCLNQDLQDYSKTYNYLDTVGEVKPRQRGWDGTHSRKLPRSESYFSTLL